MRKFGERIVFAIALAAMLFLSAGIGERLFNGAAGGSVYVKASDGENQGNVTTEATGSEKDGAGETEKELHCTFTVHKHDESCRDAQGKLICGKADYAIHTHNEKCYSADGTTRVCTLPEIKEHTHTDVCYQGTKTLVCDKEEQEGHTHTADCIKKTLTCGLEESEGHHHSLEAGCYTRVCTKQVGHEHTDNCYDADKNLTCTIETGHSHSLEGGCYKCICELPETEEHIHTDACYQEEKVLVCTKEHTHTDECYETEYTCGLQETAGHIHGEGCYKTSQTLSCNQEQVIEHTHTEGCYTDGKLACGKLEVLKHQHDDTCFKETEPDTQEEGTPLLNITADQFVAGGQTVKFTITVQVPETLPEEFIIYNKRTNLGTPVDKYYEYYSVPTITIDVDGEERTADEGFAMLSEDGEDALIIDLREAISDADVGKTVTLTYDMVVGTDINIDLENWVAYKNEVSTDLDGYETASVTGYTGVIKLTKVDAEGKVIRYETDDDGNITSYDNMTYILLYEEEDGHATGQPLSFYKGSETGYWPIFTGEYSILDSIVEVNGEAYIVGLDAGTYHITEIQAPEGYAVSRTGLNFEIKESSTGNYIVEEELKNDLLGTDDGPKKSGTVFAQPGGFARFVVEIPIPDSGTTFFEWEDEAWNLISLQDPLGIPIDYLWYRTHDVYATGYIYIAVGEDYESAVAVELSQNNALAYFVNRKDTNGNIIYSEGAANLTELVYDKETGTAVSKYYGQNVYIEYTLMVGNNFTAGKQEGSTTVWKDGKSYSAESDSHYFVLGDGSIVETVDGSVADGSIVGKNGYMYKNTAWIQYGENQEITVETLGYTGTCTLTKTDEDGEAITGSSAAFKLFEQDPDGNYDDESAALFFVKVSDGVYRPSMITDEDANTGEKEYEDGATTELLTDPATGKLRIEELGEGDYHLKEISAPTGKTINSAGKDFTISRGEDDDIVGSNRIFLIDFCNSDTPTPTTEPATTTPTTEPVTTEPTTEPVTTEPTTEPVTTEPTTEPVTTEPTTEPVTTEPTTEPVTTEPTTEEVTTEEATTEEATTEEATTEEATTEEVTTEEVTTEEATTEEATTEEATTEEATTEEQTTEAQTTETSTQPSTTPSTQPSTQSTAASTGDATQLLPWCLLLTLSAAVLAAAKRKHR